MTKIDFEGFRKYGIVMSRNVPEPMEETSDRDGREEDVDGFSDFYPGQEMPLGVSHD